MLNNSMNHEEALRLVDTAIWEKVNRHLKDIEVAVLLGSWNNQKYDEIAESCGYTPDYLKQDVGPKFWKLLSHAIGENVSKKNFRSALQRRHSNNLESKTYERIEQSSSLPKSNLLDTHQYYKTWGKAPDISFFCGRDTELNLLEQWIQKDKCRLIALIGMVGIGKTFLATKLAKKIEEQFEFVIWRSLENFPSVQKLIASLIEIFVSQQDNDLGLNLDLDLGLAKLINFLRMHRCLLILDGVEKIWEKDLCIDYSLKEYENYENFFQKIGKTNHQSCLLITSREKPRTFFFFEGKKLPIRSLSMSGLKTPEVRQILSFKENFSGCDQSWQKLTKYYSGNPLALKICAQVIQELFESNIAKFEQFSVHRYCFIHDFWDLLDKQFSRLSDSKRKIIYYVSIKRRLVSWKEIYDNFLLSLDSQISFKELLSLHHSGLIERNQDKFALSPVMMDYVTEKLISQIVEEIKTQQLVILNCYVLPMDKKHEYFDRGQKCFLTELVIKRLLFVFGNHSNLEFQLNQILVTIEKQNYMALKVGVSNIQNLLRSLKLVKKNCSSPSETVFSVTRSCRGKEVKKSIELQSSSIHSSVNYKNKAS